MGGCDGGDGDEDCEEGEEADVEGYGGDGGEQAAVGVEEEGEGVNSELGNGGVSNCSIWDCFGRGYCLKKIS